ncbi:MAG: ATP-binding protein [Dehalococcoidia bacterium]
MPVGPPRHRPPWWPANESWPPERAWGRHYGFVAPLGCLFVATFVLTMLGVITLGAFVLSSMFGGPAAPARPHWVIGIVVAAVVFIVAFSGRGMTRIARPLNALSEAAGRVAGGDYSARVAEPSRGPGAVRALVRAFNVMASRLEVSHEQRRSLLADVSHELRQPLAILRGELEAIQDGVHAPDEARLRLLLQETAILTRLVDDLRTLALSEAGTLPLHREPTDLGVLIGETVAGLASNAMSAGVTLATSIAPGLPLLDVDPVRIREVLANLLENALRYTPRGGRIDVDAVIDGPWVRVAVHDSGPGIDPDLLPRVFERFAKSDTSKGFGLGLAIARHLALAHGGTLEAASAPGEGTTMTLRLPLDPVEVARAI